MPSGPSWWFTKVDIKATFKATATVTKHGEHTRYFVAGRGRVTEQLYNKLQGDAIWKNQLRGWAAKAGVKDWNRAQSLFSKQRREHQERLKEATKEKQERTGNKDDTLTTQEIEELWQQYSYQEV